MRTIPQGHKTTVKAAFAALASLLLIACRVGPGGAESTSASGMSGRAERPPLLTSPSSAARCEPASCAAFCANAACLFPSPETCLAACERRCGDAWFEPADAEALACTTSGVGCEEAKACCRTHFTAAICAP